MYLLMSLVSAACLRALQLHGCLQLVLQISQRSVDQPALRSACHIFGGDPGGACRTEHARLNSETTMLA